jgi:hypothetical protein
VHKIKKLLANLRGYFPSKLPTSGGTEFDQFTTSIFEAYDIPNLPSYQHAIASMILHLGPQTLSKPKRYFELSIKKAMANEIAFQKIQEIKQLDAEHKKNEAKNSEVIDLSTDEFTSAKKIQ